MYHTLNYLAHLFVFASFHQTVTLFRAGTLLVLFINWKHLMPIGQGMVRLVDTFTPWITSQIKRLQKDRD